MFKQHIRQFMLKMLEQHNLPVSVHQKFLHEMLGMVGEVRDAYRGIV
jgi:hypothetical protein